MTIAVCDEREELVNPYATPARLADAHRRLARVGDATTTIQAAVHATYGPLLRDQAAADRTADLSERVATLTRELETLHADFNARFPRPRSLAHRVVERVGQLIR